MTGRQENVSYPLVMAHRTRVIKLNLSAWCNYKIIHMHTQPQFVVISTVVFQYHILQQTEIGRTGWGLGWQPFCFGMYTMTVFCTRANSLSAEGKKIKTKTLEHILGLYCINLFFLTRYYKQIRYVSFFSLHHQHFRLSTPAGSKELSWSHFIITWSDFNHTHACFRHRFSVHPHTRFTVPVGDTHSLT